MTPDALTIARRRGPARTLFGINVRSTDKDNASLSQRQRERKIRQFKNEENRALRDGDMDRAEFFKDRREKLEREL